MSSEDFPKIYLYRQIVRAKLFIDHHYGEEINLSDIADEALFSKFHFIRLFTAIYGKTPHQYLTLVRIEKARLLLDSKMPVTEVCFTVGFASLSSFTGLFKRMTGMTPSLYQNEKLKFLAAVAETPLRFIPACFAEKKGWLKNRNFQEAR